MLILASQSPRRREILDILGINYEVVPSEFDEEGVTSPSPFELAGKLATLKGKSVSNKYCNTYVLSADTVVEVDGLSLGKPKDPTESRKMLETLSGRAHNVITGVALTLNGDLIECFSEVTKVYFKELTDTEISWYISTKDPFDKAGGYGIQGPGGIFVEKIEGCYFNVVGLPLSRTANLLRLHNVFKLGV